MKIFVTVTYDLIGISIVYRYICIYNVKIFGINKENVICLPNRKYISGTDEKV